MIIDSWQWAIARAFDVPVALLQPKNVIPIGDNEEEQVEERIERIKRIMGTEPMPAKRAEGWSPVVITDRMVEEFGKAWAAQNEKPGNVVGARRRAGLEAVFRHAAAEPGIVLMTREVFERLEADARKLQALESAGVDNWSGYDSAMREIWREEEETPEERAEREAAEDEAQMFRPKPCCTEARPTA